MANPKKIVQPSDLPVRKSDSQVVAVTGGTLVFIAGMTSRSEKDATPVHPGDMRAQLRQVCENIGRALRSVGGDYSDVVKTTTFTTDVDEYHRLNDERYKYFKTRFADQRVDRGKATLPRGPDGGNRVYGGDSNGALQACELRCFANSQVSLCVY